MYLQGSQEVEIGVRSIQRNMDLIYLVLLVVAFVRNREFRKIETGTQVSIRKLNQHLGNIAHGDVERDPFGSSRTKSVYFDARVGL